jgi:hypothetical protein
MPGSFIAASSQRVNLGNYQMFLQDANGATMMAWINPTTVAPASAHIGAISVATGTAVITNVTGNGTTVTYTAANTYTAGQTISITQVNPAQYNLTNVTIATRTAAQFTITNPATGAYVSGGVSYLTTGAPTTLSSRISLETQPGGVLYMVGRASDFDVEHGLTTGPGVITANVWQHVCGVNDYVAQTQTIYINGVQVFQLTGVGFDGVVTGAPPARNSHIASQDNGLQDYFNGLIHDFRVFSRALTGPEISTIYNARGTDDIVYKLDCRYILSEWVVGTNLGTGGASQCAITNASGSGTVVTYTCNNTYIVGEIVTITGVNPGAYNLTNVTITTATGTQFTVANAATGAYVSGGSVTIPNAIPNLGNVNTDAIPVNAPTYQLGILRIP